MQPYARGASCKSWRRTLELLSEQQWISQCHNTTCCLDPGVRPLDIRGGTLKYPCYFFPVLCTCQNSVFYVFGIIVFMNSSCTLTLMLCSTTETPGGIERQSNVICVCGPGHIPAFSKLNQFSPSVLLSHSYTTCTTLISQL